MNLDKFQCIPLFLLLLGIISCETPPEFVFRVEAGEEEIPIGPIELELPPEITSYDFFTLKDGKTGQRIPIQKWGETQAVFILPKSISPNSSERFMVSPSTQDRDKSVVSLSQSDSDLLISLEEKPLLNYHIAVKQPPAGKPDYYKRSGFIHPLYSPGGQVLTNDFPEDHTHQHGIFFAWVNTTFKRRFTDFWNQQKRTGTVSHMEVIDTLSGPVFAQFTCRLQQEAILDSTQAPTPALDEVWQVRAYRMGEKTLIDLSSTFTASSEDTLFINEYHYGGMAYRGPDSWFDKEYRATEDSAVNYLGKGQGGFLTSEGKTRIDGNHSRPNWVDMHGEVEGEKVGIAFLSHPSNFRFPQPARLHPTMPYFCFSPMVLGPFDIGPEDIYQSHYRILAHQGYPESEELDQYWNSYAHPPQIKWEPSSN